MTSRRMRRVCLTKLFFLFACLLAGCGHVDISADLYSGERWEAIVEIGFPVQAFAVYGESPANIDDQLDEMVAGVRLEGVRASWDKTETDDELIYTIEMKGKGLDKLSSGAFEEEAEIYVEEIGGRRVVHFGYYVDPMLVMQPHSITLRGGEIIDGNGRLLDKGTMTWRNASGHLEATLTEQSRFSVSSGLRILALVVVGVALVTGGIYLWRRRRMTRPVPCPWCGFWVPPGARFCPGCGRSRQ